MPGIGRATLCCSVQSGKRRLRLLAKGSTQARSYRLGAPPALCGHLQHLPKLRHGTNSLRNSLTYVPLGHNLADTDIHKGT